jgi:hypothetical protein
VLEIGAAGGVEPQALALEQLALDRLLEGLGPRAHPALRIDHAVPGDLLVVG